MSPPGSSAPLHFPLKHLHCWGTGRGWGLADRGHAPCRMQTKGSFLGAAQHPALLPRLIPHCLAWCFAPSPGQIQHLPPSSCWWVVASIPLRTLTMFLCLIIFCKPGLGERCWRGLGNRIRLERGDAGVWGSLSPGLSRARGGATRGAEPPWRHEGCPVASDPVPAVPPAWDQVPKGCPLGSASQGYPPCKQTEAGLARDLSFRLIH